MQNASGGGVAALGQFIIEALQDRKHQNYKLVKDLILTKDLTKSTRCLMALLHIAYHLGRELDLLDAVFSLNVFHIPQHEKGNLLFSKQYHRRMEVYCKLLVGLSLLHRHLTAPIINSLIELFRDYDMDLDEEAKSLVINSILEVLKKSSFHQQLTVDLIIEHFPHKRESVSAHVKYVKFLLNLVGSINCLKYKVVVSRLLTLLIERTIQIDVEITIDVEDLDDDETQLFQDCEDDADNESGNANEGQTSEAQNVDQKKQQETSDDEDEMGVEFADDGHDGALVSDSQAEAIMNSGKMLKRMQAIMELLIDFIHHYYNTERGSNYRNSTHQKRQMFLTLLSIFDDVILKTHKTKYVQLVMYYLTSLDVSYAEAYVALLLQRTFDSGQNQGHFSSSSVYVRVSASAYLGSFLARAKCVNAVMINDSLSLAHQWLHGFLNQYVKSKSSRLQSHLTVWYHVVQCVIYICCFRWNDMSIVADEESSQNGDSISHITKKKKLNKNSRKRDHAASRSQNKTWWGLYGGFNLILDSHLNPLKLCSADVVAEFLAMTQTNGLLSRSNHTKKLLDSQQLLSSQSHEMREQASEHVSAASQNQVDSYFPYDPYYQHLGMHERFDPLFNKWKSVTTTLPLSKDPIDMLN